MSAHAGVLGLKSLTTQDVAREHAVEDHVAAARLNALKRLAHAVGHAAAGSSAASAAVDSLAAAVAVLRLAMSRHASRLGVDAVEPPAEWVQFEPEDGVGAELRSALAASVQGLIYIAEMAHSPRGSAVAMRVFDMVAELLSGPEPGEAFTVRMGSSAREQAAFAMLALAGGHGDTHANVVAADEPSNGAFATKSLEGWVRGYTVEAVRRLQVIQAAASPTGALCASLYARVHAAAAHSEWWVRVLEGASGGGVEPLYDYQVV